MSDRTSGLKRLLGTCMAASIVTLALVGHARAVEITAEYRASENNDDFRNTTPNSGYCVELGCEAGLFSVGIPVTYERTVRSGLPPIPERWSLQTPRETTVDVVSDEGASARLQFQITHVAQVLTEGSLPMTKLSNPASHYLAGGGCSWVTGQIYEGSSKDAGFVWKVNDPTSPSVCYPTSSYVDPQDPISPIARSFSVGYRLILPRPHTMPPGTYRGSVTYSVGETGDFSLGSQVSALSTSSVTFNFTLAVHHEMQVQFPANSDRVILEPPETWQKWLDTGVAPKKIVGSLPFRLSTSGPMSITLLCDVAYISTCYIGNQRTGEKVKFIVWFYPPKGLSFSYSPGTPVTPFIMNNNLRFRFVSSQVLHSEPGNFTFEISGLNIPELLNKGAGDEWSGIVTVVFDATI